MHNPLDQFKITYLLDVDVADIDVSLTNSGLAMLATAALIFIFFSFAIGKKSLRPGRLQALAEKIFLGIEQMVLDNGGGPEALRYFPFVLSLFLFVLVGNALGMLPFSFTFTSHLVVTFALAALVFAVVTVIALLRHGIHFAAYFLPAGTPLWLAPLLVPIEIISYLARPVSLSVRLFANMMAGHTMMKVFAGFTVALGFLGLPIVVLNGVLVGFEFLVAFLQAYVFSVLTCLYIKDAIHLH